MPVCIHIWHLQIVCIGPCISIYAELICCISFTGQNFNLRQLGICEPATRRGLAFCSEMGLPHRGYSVGAGSDVDNENEGVMSPERAMRLWGRGVKSGRNSCLSSPLELSPDPDRHRAREQIRQWERWVEPR